MEVSRFRKTVKWTVIGAAVGELFALIGCYYCYKKMNSSRDLRLKVSNYDTRIIDAYYSFQAKYGNPKLKEEDAIAWESLKSTNTDS